MAAAVKTFRITFEIGADTYFVKPLDAHPDVATKAYRLMKQTGDKEVYDVRQDPDGREGEVECDCRGFSRWQKPCKHCRALRAAGMIDYTDPTEWADARSEGSALATF